MQATEIKNGISVEGRSEPQRDRKHNFRRSLSISVMRVEKEIKSLLHVPQATL